MQDDTATLVQGTYQFKQTKQATTDGIAILPYGAIMIPASSASKTVTLTMIINGVEYNAATTVNSDSKVGSTVLLNKTE